MTARPLAAALLLTLAAASSLPAQGPTLLPVEPQPTDLRNWEWHFLNKRLVAADAPKLPDAATFDKLVVDSLRDVHNRGADLYNTSKDFAGAYRIYEGALRAVHPLLGHRPAVQKTIDDGLAAAEKETGVAQKAFRLHEAIESVRKQLKEAGDGKTPDVAPMPSDKKKPEDKKGTETKKPDDKKTDTKKPDDTKKPKDPNPAPVAAKTGTVSGKVVFKGQPLTAAEVTVVTLDLPQPRVFTAVIQADGSYSFKDPLPPGRYVVIVTAKAIPEKYSTTTTSGLVLEVKPGTQTQDIELK